MKIIKKMESEYFYNMKDNNTLYYLSYYSYIEGDYYKAYLYSQKCKYSNINLIYNILSLIKLGYKNRAKSIFNEKINILIKLYREINYFGLDEKNIKSHILQIFIIFENNKLIKEIKNPLTKEERIYYFLYTKNIIELVNDIVTYYDEYIKDIVLENIKNKNVDILKNMKNKNVDILEKFNIQPRYDRGYAKFYYKNNQIEIISYNPKENMSSMHILKYKEEYLIIDCGAYIDSFGNKVEIDIEEFFKEKNLDKNKIKGVFITHAHLDHYGSLEQLKEFEIYMTKETYDLIDYINTTSNNSKVNINEFDITLIKLNKNYILNNFQITPILNGHILGSCAYLIFIKEINKKILITGDFCLNDQNIIKGMELDKCNDIDYLVIETTYGNKMYSFTYEDRLKLLLEVIDISLNCKIPVLIPAFAVGRTQELLSIIAENFKYSKILVDGTSIGCTKIYNKYYQNLLDYDNIEYGRDDLCIEEKFKLYNIIISSSGMLQEGSKSKLYFDFVKQDDNPYMVIKSGFMHQNSKEYKELQFYDGILFNYFDIGISAHATYNQLLYLINYIKPKKVIMVHGKGINI